jgi:DNA helicase-2/ATP-dependent DNA helicase PcrA
MNLTQKQKEIVEATTGHYVVLAGPGCGKTHTITEKILYIFEKEVISEPYGLLAVTFTNTAACTMRSRLRLKGFDQWSRIWIGTYHSLGRHILERYGGDIGIREDFEIIEDPNRDSVLRRLISNHSIHMSLRECRSSFEELKRKGIYPGKGDNHLSSEIREAYGEYNQMLRSRNLLDLGDLVALAVELLQKSDLANRLYATCFRYLVVDEFQDTDEQQLEMIRFFAEPAIGSTIMCDDDQAIFEWRGARRQNIYRIKELLGSEEVVLALNFRSDEVIVEAARKVIGFDSKGRKKDMKAVSSERGHLYKRQFHDPNDEAEYVVKWIKDAMENMVDNPGDIAVIARKRRRTRWAKEEMDSRDIPWFDRFSLKFDDSWETKLALSIIELAHDPTSSTFLHGVMASAEEAGPACCFGNKDAFDMALDIRDRLKCSQNLELNPYNVSKILNVAGMKEILQNAPGGLSSLRRRTRNLDKMKTDIILESRKQEISLLDVTQRFSGRAAIQIVSGHEAKGREFDVVFFIGLEDDILPDERDHDDEDRLAEERRIFYVGLTRARRAVYLTNVADRLGSGRVRQVPSRFIEYIPDEYFDQITF